eukprot:4967839-Prymnesium_polylepis.1
MTGRSEYPKRSTSDCKTKPKGGKLFGEDALALLRHAYGQFHHDFANVDLKEPVSTHSSPSPEH